MRIVLRAISQEEEAPRLARLNSTLWTPKIQMAHLRMTLISSVRSCSLETAHLQTRILPITRVRASRSKAWRKVIELWSLTLSKLKSWKRKKALTMTLESTRNKLVNLKDWLLIQLIPSMRHYKTLPSHCLHLLQRLPPQLITAFRRNSPKRSLSLIEKLNL